MGSLASKETGGSGGLEKVERSKLIVAQPKQLKELGQILDTIESLSQRVSEGSGEDRSGDMGSAGTMVGAGAGTTGMSPRDEAIAHLPAAAVMQKQLEEHIRKEVKRLNREAKLIAKQGKPGAAYALNNLYARIRRLNALIAELFEASVEVLKRLFIRVFIDKQPVI
ncbi:hypothetical protein HYZ99_02540 [Candidatus Peregrinibacteria bacterium]|nr:hypothetical protein [Candidatus Peregrinibacteria bacterium]